MKGLDYASASLGVLFAVNVAKTKCAYTVVMLGRRAMLAVFQKARCLVEVLSPLVVEVAPLLSILWIVVQGSLKSKPQ